MVNDRNLEIEKMGIELENREKIMKKEMKVNKNEIEKLNKIRIDNEIRPYVEEN